MSVTRTTLASARYATPRFAIDRARTDVRGRERRIMLLPPAPIRRTFAERLNTFFNRHPLVALACAVAVMAVVATGCLAIMGAMPS